MDVASQLSYETQDKCYVSLALKDFIILCSHEVQILGTYMKYNVSLIDKEDKVDFTKQKALELSDRFGMSLKEITLTQQVDKRKIASGVKTIHKIMS